MPIRSAPGASACQQGEIDIILTSGPSHSTHLIGGKLRKNLAVPWVVDMRDPWTDGYFGAETTQSWLARRMDRRMESSVLSGADAVVSVSDGPGKWVQRKGLARRYQSITIGFDPEDLPVRRVASGRRNSFVIARFGTQYRLGHASGLVRARQRLRRHLRVTLHLAGAVDDAVMQEYRRAELDASVKYVAHVPRSEVLEAMGRASLQLVAIQRLEHFQVESTGKLFGYLGVGVPILAIARPAGEPVPLPQATKEGRPLVMTITKAWKDSSFRTSTAWQKVSQSRHETSGDPQLRAKGIDAEAGGTIRLSDRVNI